MRKFGEGEKSLRRYVVNIVSDYENKEDLTVDDLTLAEKKMFLLHALCADDLDLYSITNNEEFKGIMDKLFLCLESEDDNKKIHFVNFLIFRMLEHYRVYMQNYINDALEKYI